MPDGRYETYLVAVKSLQRRSTIPMKVKEDRLRETSNVAGVKVSRTFKVGCAPFLDDLKRCLERR